MLIHNREVIPPVYGPLTTSNEYGGRHVADV